MSGLYYVPPESSASRAGTAGPSLATGGPAAGTRGIYGGAPSEFELVPREYWPTVIFSRKYRDHARDAASIIAHLYELKNESDRNIASGVAPSSKSKDGLFESTFDLFEKTENPELRRLISFIESSVRRVVWYVNDRAFDPKRVRVTFTDSWFHITNNSGFHDAHYHGGCSWCGIYYLQMSDIPTQRPDHAPNGVSRFYCPRPFGGMQGDLGNAYLGHGHIDVPPEPGMLILFPAYLLHSGLPYKGAIDRVLLAFNTTSSLDPEPGTS